MYADQIGSTIFRLSYTDRSDSDLDDFLPKIVCI